MTTSERASAPVSRRIHGLFLGLLACAALLAYSNNFTAEFVYDDYPFIVENQGIRTLSNAGRFFFERESFSSKGEYVIYRPLASLSFALNYRLSGYNAAPYHAANILLHLACGLALYLLIYTTLGDAVFAFFVALLFLVHPVQTEAVAWISGRGNSMFLLFLLLAVFCYRKWTYHAPRGRIFYGAALLLYALSLLSKEMAVVLPILLIVYDLSLNRPSDGGQWKRRCLAIIPFFALSFGYVVLRHLVLGQTGQTQYWGGGLLTTLLTMAKGLAYYVRLMFVPTPLMVEYIIPISRSLLQPTVLISLFALLCAALICALSYRKAPVVFFGIAWFFASILPVSNIIPLKAIINERFLYLPSIGFCVLLAIPVLAAGAGARKKEFRRTIAALLLIALCWGILTFDRNRDWRDSFSLWTASVKTSPAGPTSRYNMGLELYNRGRYDEAVEHLEIACLLQEQFPIAHGALGNVYLMQGRYDDAIGEYEIGLDQAPDDVRIKQNLAAAWLKKGEAHIGRGETHMAERSFLKALSYDAGLDVAKEELEKLRGAP